MDGFGTAGATVCTTEHHMHKARRVPLNPFFSKANVYKRQDLIHQHIQRFCNRMLELSETGKNECFNLGAAISAFTRDVSTEFILGKTYNCLDKDDFDYEMTNVFQKGGHMWRIGKHITWFLPLLKSLPVDLVMKVTDDGTKIYFQFLKV